jgi:hypothetical protein
MNSNNIHTRVQQVKTNYETLIKNHESDVARLNELGEQITKIRDEQALVETSKTVMEEAKKILTKTSLEYCERLATVAVKTIFNLPAEVKYSSTDGKFYLMFDDGMISDIAGDEGGGIKTVISFVFSLYLVIKSNSRRVMFFDEAWTQVSAEYFPVYSESCFLVPSLIKRRNSSSFEYFSIKNGSFVGLIKFALLNV